MGQVPEVLAAAAEAGLEHVQGPLAKLADGADAQPLEDLAALLADAPEPLDRQRIEELLHLVRLHDDQGVGLLQVAGDLGQELVGGHAHRGHQPQLLADRLLDLPPDLDRRAEQVLAAGHVQEGFVQRQRLHQRREPLEDFADLAGDFGVVVDPGRQVDAVRAEPMGGGGGHGTVDAVLAGDVVGRRHHAPLLRRAAHDDRLADQFRPVPLLDRGVEGIHVDVQDHRQRLLLCCLF